MNGSELEVLEVTSNTTSRLEVEWERKYVSNGITKCIDVGTKSGSANSYSQRKGAKKLLHTFSYPFPLKVGVV